MDPKRVFSLPLSQSLSKLFSYHVSANLSLLSFAIIYNCNNCSHNRKIIFQFWILAPEKPTTIAPTKPPTTAILTTPMPECKKTLFQHSVTNSFWLPIFIICVFYVKRRWTKCKHVIMNVRISNVLGGAQYVLQKCYLYSIPWHVLSTCLYCYSTPLWKLHFNRSNRNSVCYTSVGQTDVSKGPNGVLPVWSFWMYSFWFKNIYLQKKDKVFITFKNKETEFS